MSNLVNICSERFYIVFVLTCAVMAYFGSKQYKLLGNGEVRRCFKDRFYELLGLLFAVVNWPLYMIHESEALKALQESGIDEALLRVEESRSIGTVALMLIAFPIIFFCIGKVAALARLGYFYDWDEPAEDIVEKDNKEDK